MLFILQKMKKIEFKFILIVIFIAFTELVIPIFNSLAAERSHLGIQSLEWGEYITINSWKSLFLQLDQIIYPPGFFTQDEVRILDQLRYLYFDIRESIPELRRGDDPAFVLNPHEPHRTGVTGTDENDKILINRDKVNDSQNVHFSSLIQLLIHELGHKIKNRSIEEIDKLAAKLQRVIFSREIHIPLTLANGKTLFIYVCNPAHFRQEGWSEEAKWSHKNIFPFVGIKDGKLFYPLESFIFNHHLLKNSNPESKEHYNNISIENIHAELADNTLRLNVIIRHGLYHPNDNSYYSNQLLEQISVPLKISKTDDGPLELIPQSNGYWTHPAFGMQKGVELSVKIHETPLKMNLLSLEGELKVDLQKNDLFIPYDMNKKLINIDLIYEINGVRQSIKPYDISSDPVPSYNLTSEFIQNSAEELIKFRAETPISFDSQSEELDLRIFGIVLSHQYKNSKFFEEQKIWPTNTRFIPIKESKYYKLNKGLLSSLGKEFYFMDIQVISPFSSFRKHENLKRFGMGNKSLKLFFKGKEYFENLQLIFNIEKYENNQKITKEEPLVINLNSSQFIQKIRGNQTILIIDPFNFGHSIDENNFPFHLLGSDWKLSLKSISAELRRKNGESGINKTNHKNYKESFSKNGFDLLYRPALNLTKKQIEQSVEKYFDQFEWGVGDQSVSKKQHHLTCKSLFE